MSYTVGQIKVAAYNRTELDNMTIQEQHLWFGLAYCYDWYRMYPHDSKACKELMQKYIQFFENQQLKEL